jgi:hypothetical protein
VPFAIASCIDFLRIYPSQVGEKNEQSCSSQYLFLDYEDPRYDYILRTAHNWTSGVAAVSVAS